MGFKKASGNKKVNGIDLYYEFYAHPSSKNTIVLIHGFLSSSFSYRRLIPLLKNDFNVFSIDFPPFGKSGKSLRYTYSYDNIAQTIIHFIKMMGIDKIIIMGHSMGGQISLNIAYKQPTLVEKVILLCSSAYLQRAKRSLIFVSYFPFFYLYIKYWLGKSGVKQNLKNVIYDHTLIDHEMISGYLTPFQQNDIFRALTRMIRHREGDLSSEKLQTIETPCLLIWGEDDKIVPLNVGEKLNKELPNSQIVIFKETGHLLPEERPLDVFRHVLKFVNETN
ncbi:alpha/beta hydrolase [Bacillus aquiflavi]|uniref:Alpha/beta hydrolase n=1 Tax=Bacillus aquiflavi TaxID=2672567 RepID=A0A6B3VT79_9BACI|nr:alpha/beta hydrolase [Bacillus aquiflavi]MBA4536044.1 alpha/beta hydrolase [Bacillus aquiflavi]NEY80418.1 alpha/beta hydrolase [Bacillus aquiflavi]